MSLLIQTPTRVVTYNRLSHVANTVRASVKRVSAHIEAMRLRVNWLADDILAEQEADKARARAARFSAGLAKLRRQTPMATVVKPVAAVCAPEAPAVDADALTIINDMAIARSWNTGGPGLEPPAPVHFQCTVLATFNAVLTHDGLRWA